MSQIWKRLAPALLGAVALAAGCARPNAARHQPASGDPNVLTVYVSCAFVPAVEAIRGKFEAANPRKSVKVEGGEPDALVKRIEGGAAPDVLISLGESEFGLLEREGFMDSSLRRNIGAFRAVLATPASKPAIDGPGALTSDTVKSIVMPTPGNTSLGTEIKHSLSRLGVWDKIQSKLVLRSRQSETIADLGKGDADVGAMYDPCPFLKLRGKIPADSVKPGPALSPASARPTRLEMGIHKRSPRTQLAQKFIGFMASDEVKADWTAAGITSGAPESGGAEQPRPQ